MAPPTDFVWLATAEPHAARRRAILAAHPEIKRLFGHEPRTKYIVAALVALQLCVAHALRADAFWSWRVWLVAYVVGATANHALFLAVHELSHGLAFRSLRANRLFAVFANMPVVAPFSVSFREYHMEHHTSLGKDGVDVDVPTRFEAHWLTRAPLTKLLYLATYIVFYAVRPLVVRPKPFGAWHALNAGVQLAFNAAVWRAWGGTALAYLALSTLLGGSLHPCAAHFLAEHFVLEPPHETYSYLGVGNYFTWFVGYQ